VANFTFINRHPAVAKDVTLLVGEVSEPIGIRKEERDPDLDAYLVKLPRHSRVAFAETLSPVPRFNLPEKEMRAVTVTGRRPGETSILFVSVGDKLTELGTVNVKVKDFDKKDQDVDIFYLGQYIVWRRSLPPQATGEDMLMFAASSGKNGVASAQTLRDVGPLPEGRYTLLAQFDPLQNTVEKANRLLAEGDTPGKGPFQNYRPGIQRLPSGGLGTVNIQWGDTRARLDPLFNVPGGRSGFYLHDSHKGHTSGCVEVRRDDSRQLFFDALINYASSPSSRKKPTLILKVMYRDMATPTHGHTIETL
jgi:hypothetical protein